MVKNNQLIAIYNKVTRFGGSLQSVLLFVPIPAMFANVQSNSEEGCKLVSHMLPHEKISSDFSRRALRVQNSIEPLWSSSTLHCSADYKCNLSVKDTCNVGTYLGIIYYEKCDIWLL